MTHNTVCSTPAESPKTVQQASRSFYAQIAIKTSLALFIGSVLSGLAAYGTRMILTRALSVTEYGLFYGVFSFVSFFLLFRDFGLPTAIIKYVADFHAKKKYHDLKTALVSVTLVQFVSSVVIAVVLFAFADVIAASYFKEPKAALLLKFFVVYIFTSLFAIMLKAILMGFRSKFFPFFELFKNTTNLLFLLVAAPLSFGVLLPLFGQIFSWIIMIGICVYILLRHHFQFFDYHVTNLKSSTKLMLSFGLPVLLATIGYQVIGQIDTLFLVYLRTLDEVGVYNTVLPASLVFLLFGKSVADIIFPLFAEMWAKHEQSKIQQGVTEVYKYGFILSAPVLLFFFVYARLFLELSFGLVYGVGAQAFQILLIGILFYIMVMINNHILAAIGKPAITTKIVLGSAVLNIVLNTIFIPPFGMGGAALATSLSYLTMLLFSTLYVAKELSVAPPWLFWTKSFVAGGIYLAVAYGLESILDPIVFYLRIPFVFLVACLGYVAALFLLRMVSWQEVQEKKRLLFRVFGR
ncbi:MAG TPA: flippase [Candidatus Nanoarchaeia archaeon]|nr:flippase [Candidatus Nanoarchaeia archaeon]